MGCLAASGRKVLDWTSLDQNLTKQNVDFTAFKPRSKFIHYNLKLVYILFLIRNCGHLIQIVLSSVFIYHINMNIF